MPRSADVPLPNRLLRSAREARGWSQEYVAERIGVTARTVSRWELGLTTPYPHSIHALSHLFDMTASELGLDGTAALGAFPQSEATHAAILSLVPAAPSYVIGRDSDLEAVRRQLLRAEAVAVTGLPGVGKTTLALLLARDPIISAHFQGNVLWAALGPNDNVPEIMSSLGKVLGFSARQMAAISGEKSRVMLRAAIGDRPFLIILDDVWEERTARTLSQIAGPRCVWLYTSRFRKVAAELAGGLHTYTLDELNVEQGMQLVRHFAPSAVDLEPAGIEGLIRSVGGVPLALRLIGRTLEQQAISGQARRVQTVLEEFNEAREKLHSAIAVSEYALSDETRVALYTLAILPAKPESFSEEAALTVAACQTSTLDTLLDLGLVESCGSGCYRMHQVIADYCHTQLVQRPEVYAAAYGRLLDYAVQIVMSSSDDYPTLDQHAQTILEALKAAVTLEKHDELIQLMLCLAPFFNYRGWNEEAEHALYRACEVARQERRLSQLLRLLLYFAEFSYKRAAFQETLAAQFEGLQLARMLHNDEITAALLAHVAWQAYLSGSYDQAEACIQEGMKLFAQTSHPNLKYLCMLLKAQGAQAWARGDYQTCEQAYLRGLQVMERLNERDWDDLAFYCCFLGWIEGMRGYYEQAEQYFQRALEAADTYMPDFQPFVQALRVQVILVHQPAKELYGELAQALRRAKALTAVGYSVDVWKGLALLEVILGNYEKAERFARYGVEMAQRFRTESRMGELLTVQAQVEIARGHMGQAAALVEKALPLVKRGPTEEVANTFVTWGEVLFRAGQLDEAEAAFEEALQVAPPEHRPLRALAGYGQARTAAARGDREEARRRGEAALKICKEVRHYRTREIQNWLAPYRHPWLQVLRLRKE